MPPPPYVTAIGRLALAASLTSILACAGAEGSAASADAARGPWEMMYFAGGPPMAGQATDTLRCDPSVGRRVRIERSVAGTPGTRVCEADIVDDEAWTSLTEAMRDDDLQAALAHPDRVPGLVIDAGYFTCRHRGVDVAASSASSSDAAEVRAIKRLQSAYGRVRSAALATPACSRAMVQP